ncbi:MAG: DUF4411 family protein [Candidatus Thiodiazotropha sp. (ex Lucinoma borealis)]|nr:DUF4411 family protein [Candidatus Thiodiazotropha sp. (ex Lucinoma borealis)]
MNSVQNFIIDSDVLIRAKNSYYAFSICPGFWESIIHQFQLGRVYSLDRVRQELLTGRDDDDLVQWVHDDVPSDFFLITWDQDVVSMYTEIMLWAQQNTQFYDNAKAKFATGADGWLVAYARVYGLSVVTQEQPSPEARSIIKLPDVCDQFGVLYQDTFAMLKALGVSYGYMRES